MIYLAAVGANTAYALLCAILGAGALGALRLRYRAFADAVGGAAGFWAVAYALGAGLSGAWLTLLALAGAFSWMPIAASLATAMVLSAWGTRTLAPERPRASPRDADVRILAGATVVLAVVYGLRSLGPFLQGDAVAYYIPVARSVAQSGRLGLTWVNYAPYFSFGAEAHMALMWKAAGEPGITLYGYVVALAALGVTYGLARAGGLTGAAAAVTPLVLLSMGAFQDAVGGGKVDLAAAVPGAASLLVALGAVWRGLPRRAFVVAGLLAGFSVTAKISNALLLPVLGVALVWFWVERAQERRRLVQAALIFTAAFAAAMSVHVYKSWAMLGEPLVPFVSLKAWSGLPDWASNATKVVGMIAAQRTLSNLDLALLPLTWTYVDRPWMGGNISPLYLAFLPLGLALRWPGRMKLYAAMAVAAVAAWFVVSPFTLQTRYHFIGLFVLAAPVGWVAGAYLRRPETRRYVWIALGLAIALGLVGARKVRHVPGLLTGGLTRDAYFAKYSWQAPFAAFGAWVRDHVPAGDRLYLTRTAWYYAYFLGDDVLARSQTNDEALVVYRLDWSPEVWRDLYQRGFRYVMVGKHDLPRGEADEASLARVPDALAVDVVYEDADTKLVALSPRRLSPPVEDHWQQ